MKESDQPEVIGRLKISSECLNDWFYGEQSVRQQAVGSMQLRIASDQRIDKNQNLYLYLMTKDDIIAEIKQSLQPLNINKAILFGSYAKGKQSDDSDIDLLIVTNDNVVFQSFKHKMETKLRISKALHSLRKFADIDLIVHTKPMFEKFVVLNSGFKNEILNSGSVIYEAHN